MNRENSFITKQNLAQLILNDDYFVTHILFLVLVSFGMVLWASLVRRNTWYTKYAANLGKEGLP